MLYYVLNASNGSFVVKYSAESVGTFLLGKHVMSIVIFKVDQDGARQYFPRDGDVFKIQKELEEL